MTQREFTERTLVEVSAEEFNAINIVYMNSILDKDEFCKVWRKMNANRVERAKEAKKEAQKRYNRCSQLLAIMQTLDMMMEQYKYGSEWFCELKDKQMHTLESEGIDFYEYGRIKSTPSLRCDIREKIDEIASIK